MSTHSKNPNEVEAHHSTPSPSNDQKNPYIHGSRGGQNHSKFKSKIPQTPCFICQEHGH